MNALTRILSVTAMASACASAWGNPTGASVARGAALLSNPSANVLQVVNTPGTVINWQGFSIGVSETTRFVQQNAASAVLNRVVGANPSSILGRLESNGRVFLVNPNGIVFGGGSVVDVAGLIASTRDITDANFLAGNYLFNGTGNGTITMQSGAQILTSTYGPGGQVWLFAKNVTQEAGATMTAPDGQAVLVAGTQLQVATNGLGQMAFAVTTDGSNTVDSLGTIAADRGAVGLFADFVNHRGTINAPNGTVSLHGGAKVDVTEAAVINADGANGKITFRSNDIQVVPSGNVHAVDGEVVFDQYAPSQWTVDTRVWAAPFFASGTNIGASNLAAMSEGAVVAPQSNGTFLLRYMTLFSNFHRVFEVLLDADGTVLSVPSQVGGDLPSTSDISTRLANIAAMTTGLGRYFSGPGSGIRLFTGSGGSVQDTPVLASIVVAGFQGLPLELTTNFYASNGNLLGQASHSYPNGEGITGGSLPLRDGSVANRDHNPSTSVPTIKFFKADGTAIGSRDSTVHSGQIQYATPAGMIFIDGLLSGFDGKLYIERWSKNVPAYTAGTPFGGNAGVTVNFATMPGAANDGGASATPPPQPPASPPTTPVVSGNPNGGSSFEGVAGCNSAVCATEVRGALSVTSAIVASQKAATDSSGGRIDEQSAADAVAALARAQTGGRSAADNQREGLAVMRDYGEMERLVSDIGRSLGSMTPEEVRQQTGLLDGIVKDFMEKELIMQQLGVYRTDPNAMDLVGALQNMNSEERAAFGLAIRESQARGQ